MRGAWVSFWKMVRLHLIEKLALAPLDGKKWRIGFIWEFGGKDKEESQ